MNKQTFTAVGVPGVRSSAINPMSNATMMQKMEHCRTHHISGISAHCMGVFVVNTGNIISVKVDSLSRDVLDTRQ